MGLTARNALPYPEYTDPVAEGDDNIRALAEAVNGWFGQVVTDDPAEIGLTARTDWEITEFRAAQAGGIAAISARFAYSGATITGQATGNITNVNIADGLLMAWVPRVLSVFMFSRGGATFGTGAVLNDGRIQIRTLHKGGTIASGQNLVISAYYAVNTDTVIT